MRFTTSFSFQNLLLSLIAVLLVGIFIQNQYLIGQMQRVNQAPERPTAAVAAEGQRPVLVAPLNADGTIDVNIKSAKTILDVNIEKVDGSSLYYSVPVTIK